MTVEEKLDQISAELVQTKCEVSALKDLVATLMAELANASSDGQTHFSRMVEDEQNATYRATTQHEDISEHLEKVLVKKAAFKAEVFRLSQVILGRIEATRD